MTGKGDMPSPDRYLDATFGEGGYLSRAFPGYTPRAGQIALAHAVDRSIVEKRHLLAEAPVATGKSIGYSVPATYHAVRTKSPVVIVTANIALQEQIATKDLPLLQKILPWEFTFQLLKGRNNYLCLDTFLKTESGKVKPQGTFSWGAAVGNDTRRETQEQIRQRAVVTAWAHDSMAGSESGDASELPFEVDHHVWRDFSVSADACKGYKCRHAADCFSQQARVRAQSVNVIVTNYHLLCAHLAVYMKTGLDLILPPFEVVIADECFPAGTRVDGNRTIEDVQVGDEIPSYDEESGTIVRRVVRQRFVSRPSSLVRVTVGYRSIVCTPGHPFLTQRGWVPAASLHVGDSVTCSVSHDQEIQYQAKTTRDHAVRRVRHDGDRNRHGDVALRIKGESLLREGIRNASSQWSQAEDSGRQRSGRPGSTGGSITSAWVANQARSSDENASQRRSTVALQDGHRRTESEDRDRGRRIVAQHPKGESRGQAQGRLPSFARVDRVEVLEPGRGGRFGGLCPDGLVYNLEVEGTHTYLAEGVVVHNCHKFPDIARDFFGFKFSEGTVKSLAKRVRSSALADALLKNGNYFFSAMSGLRRDRNRYKSHLTLACIGDHELRAWRALAPVLDETFDEFASQVADASDEDAEAEANNLRTRAGALRDGLTIAMSEAPSSGVVCYLDENERGAVSVCSKLVRASDALRPALFQKRTAPRPPRVAQPNRTQQEVDYGFEAHAEPIMDHDPLLDVVLPPTATDGIEDTPMPHPDAGKPVTVIGASATLATGTSFAFAIEELGVDDPETMIAESPFDWPNQALFVVPDGLPEPNDKAFPDAVANTVETMIRMAKGSVLGLFTSRRVLAHVYDSIFASCREQGIVLMKQGDAPRTVLVERFRADTSSVLLGLESFWAGVDVPGDALRIVVIDRLPFPTPDDPIVAALSLQDDRVFWTHSVPRAIVTFRQGAGRLIRAAGDKGVIVCCDKRLITKKYGKQFLRSLPPVPKSTSLATADAWLNPKPPPAWDEP